MDAKPDVIEVIFNLYNENGEVERTLMELKKEYINNGFHPGLYVLGAANPKDKTTFLHQMAKELAADGMQVRFLYSEHSKHFRRELEMKSLTRIIANVTQDFNCDIPLLDAKHYALKHIHDPRVTEAAEERDKHNKNCIFSAHYFGKFSERGKYEQTKTCRRRS